MKRVKYVGKKGPAEIEVHGCGTVERDREIDVPDEVADELVKTRPTEWKLARSGKSGDTVGAEKEA